MERNPNLLSLVRDLHRLVVCTNRHICSTILGRNCELLVFKLCEANRPDLDISNFLEAVETLENRRQVLLGDICRDILQEKSLVWSDVLVGYGGSSCLDGSRLVFGNSWGSLLLVGLLGEFPLCARA